MKIRICTICGTEFESRNGKQVCSESCRLERKKLQDAKGNQRRREGLSNILEIMRCPMCGKSFEACPNRVYCSKECYFVSKKEMDKKNYKMYYSNPEWRKAHIEKVKLKKST